ncbi:hypothetical protein [Paraburkholderia caballeronis]|uniref:hypothetical protein n=1 Tax=Paraburkholderia caballeronis TaxID=416943 RepID=UPI0010E140A0|nr:hypothetical protein [Paraburkholderia caballeronis]TDV11485.1 hypothetical protein C7408_112133 [Paraburkholderia caballeronis]TDV14675.1 hypothetical protein C7406_113133 [Paraburkholderia caballeronis]TDV23746.1 hypothetical protein C7404_112133 [Paraburkholderia caballeronis]
MDYALKPVQLVEVKLLLHPADLRRAQSAAREANLTERDFYALAIHLGTAEILHSVRRP